MTFASQGRGRSGWLAGWDPSSGDGGRGVGAREEVWVVSREQWGASEGTLDRRHAGACVEAVTTSGPGGREGRQREGDRICTMCCSGGGEKGEHLPFLGLHPDLPRAHGVVPRGVCVLRQPGNLGRSFSPFPDSFCER